MAVQQPKTCTIHNPKEDGEKNSIYLGLTLTGTSDLCTPMYYLFTKE